MDQRPVEQRSDVLVYSSETLREDVEVTGPISLVLYAATTAPDTDFTGKLVDVYPDGRAINLTDGILRTRYRDGLDQPKLLTKPGAVKFTIDLGVTSNLFRKGHKIRLEVSSSNFPRFDRNPNTGRPVADESRLATALQTVYHDRRHRSYLNLPVIPPKLPARVTGPKI
jgi:putative CocE/NonD family hydrolase